MREDEQDSRKFRFSPFELDVCAAELRKHRSRIRLQTQPLKMLIALLDRPGRIVSREELRRILWPGKVFVDYEHSLNRSMNKLRRALGDTARKPRYIETVHGQGYRFIGCLEDEPDAKQARLAVVPVVNGTGLPANDDLADGITEAMIDGLGNALSGQMRVIALACVLRYKNKRIRMAKMAAELRADYLVCGRLREGEDRYILRVELVDAHDRTLRWAESFQFACDGLEPLQRKICSHIVGGIEPELAQWNNSTPHSDRELKESNTYPDKPGQPLHSGESFGLLEQG